MQFNVRHTLAKYDKQQQSLFYMFPMAFYKWHHGERDGEPRP